MANTLNYIQYFVTFALAQSISMWGQFYTLKFKKMSMIEAFFRAIPFAWVDWFFMTIAIGLSTKYELFTPTQDIFILTILQFTLVLIINKFWLKQALTRSDIICFFIILFGLYVSVENLVSKTIGWEVPVHDKDNKK
jgi:hypothetical protein